MFVALLGRSAQYKIESYKTMICGGSGFTVLRAIHIFPEFSNMESIDNLRAKYDPLFSLIQPHVTLVFPFESTITTAVLAQHVQIL